MITVQRHWCRTGYVYHVSRDGRYITSYWRVADLRRDYPHARLVTRGNYR